MRAAPLLLLAGLVVLARADDSGAEAALHQDAPAQEQAPSEAGSQSVSTERAPASPGRAALEQARKQSSGASAVAGTASDAGASEEGGSVGAAANGTEGEKTLPAVHCASGPCVELESSLLSVVEGPLCRSLFVNGKCPTGCATALAGVTGNTSWEPCASACGNDVVNGAAERWMSLCGVRQETLIDQGKEAVKSVLGEGLSTRLHWRAVRNFFFAVLLLVVGVGYGYRRGSVSAQYAYRLQKRRLLGRKSSDPSLPI